MKLSLAQLSTDADITGAVVTGAIFTDAIVTGAIVTGSVVTGAVGYWCSWSLVQLVAVKVDHW